jgi:serine/threonine protein kinase
MTPEEWSRAKELFDAALEQEPTQRAAFLAQACPDDSLRQEVEELVINFQEAGSFLSNPVLRGQTPKPSEILEVRAEDESPGSSAGSRQPLSTIQGTDDPMVGRHLGVYKLGRRIGQGGMAAVFLAVRADGEFRQQVAIKLLLPGLDSHEVVRRLRTERQTLAGLDHPNIVKLLDGGSTLEGLPYLVMDYVEGSPIDEYCDSYKLSIEQRLRLFGKVCEAVQHAHQRLIIHRDLKPGNILVTAEGVPKLLDFGIAKVLEPTTGPPALTQTGTRCMTPAYASPEQVRGKSVTAATDIYSLGVVLYELLTGHRPYRLKERTASEMERAICEQEPENPSTAVNRVESETSSDGTRVTKTPEVVSETREGQPERLRRRLRGDLDNIVLKALEKEPTGRYSSVEEFGRDIDRHLRHLPVKASRSTLTYRTSRLVKRHKVEASAASVLVLGLAAAWLTSQAFGLRDRTPQSPSMRIRSLAVLPLANLSGDPTQEYFSDGVTDELITDLAQIGSLKVISRTSSMQYKQTKKPLPEIARELKVDGIIEGSVQRSGDRVRITAQLIEGTTDKYVWAKSYEGDTHDAFALERQVTEEIARQIQAHLETSDQRPPAQSRRVNSKVLDTYLEGNYHLHRYSRGAGDEEKRKASVLFQQVIDAEPDFAQAYVGMARAHYELSRGSSEDTRIVRRAAEKAVQLDPASSDAWLILADVKVHPFWDWSGAEHDFQKAITVGPSNAAAHASFGNFLGEMGQLDEGLKECDIAQQLDPNEDHLAFILYLRREYDRAIAGLEMMLKLHPNDGNLHAALYSDYVKKGMYKESVQHLSQAVDLFGFPEAADHIHRAFVRSGFPGAMRQFAKALEHLNDTKQVFCPGNIALAYAALGERDRAFYWLEQAYQHHDAVGTDVPLPFLIRDPMADPLRSDPRFADLVRRLGLQP